MGGAGKRTAIDQPLEIVGSGLMLTLNYLHTGKAHISDRAWKLGSKDKNESLCWYTWPSGFSISLSQFPRSRSKGHQKAPVRSSLEETFWNFVLTWILSGQDSEVVLGARRSSYRGNFRFPRREFLSYGGAGFHIQFFSISNKAPETVGCLICWNLCDHWFQGWTGGSISLKNPGRWSPRACWGCGRKSLMKYWMCYDL